MQITGKWRLAVWKWGWSRWMYHISTAKSNKEIFFLQRYDEPLVDTFASFLEEKQAIVYNNKPWASWQIRKIADAHAPGMPGTFSPPPWVSNPDMHHGTCVTHVSRCITGSLSSSFLWIRRRGEHARRSRRKRNPQFYVSAKRPM